MRKLRLLAPVGVAGAIALGTAIPTLTSASAATPDLPSITPQQLLVKVQHAQVQGLSGTVRWTANLGLPDISGLTSGGGQDISSAGFDPTSLLSGSHDISVWDDGPGKQRLALPGSLSETDLVHNGSDVWLFDSATSKVTHYVGAARPGGHEADGSDPAQTPLTPDQVAQRVLDAVTPSTTVSVVTPVYVAHRATYELQLVPKATDSTIGSVTIAVDAASGLPLRVEVTPKGSSTPALSLGYVGDLSLSVPAASNFAAPVGTTTVTKTIGGGSGDHQAGDHHSDGTKPSVTGSGWGSIVTVATPGAGSGRALSELDRASTAVSGSFGTGRLVTTNLLNALVLPDGTILAGFVTPAALEAAAAPAAG